MVGAVAWQERDPEIDRPVDWPVESDNQSSSSYLAQEHTATVEDCLVQDSPHIPHSDVYPEGAHCGPKNRVREPAGWLPVHSVLNQSSYSPHNRLNWHTVGSDSTGVQDPRR